MFRSLIVGGARWLSLGAATLLLASCGGGSSTTCVDGVGGTACEGSGTNTTVANLSLNLSALTVNNSGSESITATAVATNANNQTMSAAPVVLRVDSNAEIAVAGAVTDTDGKIVGTVRIGDNRSNRTITVTATANNGALSTTKTFQVVGAKLTGTPVPAVVAPGAAGEIKYRLLDSNSNPMTAMAVAVTGPGGVETIGTTGSNGEFNYVYTAPNTTGDLELRATAGGNTSTVTVLVQQPGGGSIPNVDPLAQPVRSASVSANPSVVAVNTGSTNNQSQIRVLFLTNANAPIKNMRVRFDLDGDKNSIGGSFTTGDNVVYSDANGVATSAYVPGTRASPTDGVTIRACWGYSDFTTCNVTQSVTTTLTVVADPVSVSIGTNALIETGDSGLTYVKRYVVQVVDSSGVAKPDVQITPSVDLLKYFKGFWTPVADGWIQEVQASCDNEDLNRNSTNEVYADGWVEDANGSFNLTPGRPALEPRKADVAISFEGSSRTNASGIVVLRIEYPQNLGSWVEFNILVAASGISATEGRANFEGRLPVPASAINDPKVSPPFVSSPYGIQTSPLLVYTPAGGATRLLCTNPN